MALRRVLAGLVAVVLGGLLLAVGGASPVLADAPWATCNVVSTSVGRETPAAANGLGANAWVSCTSHHTVQAVRVFYKYGGILDSVPAPDPPYPSRQFYDDGGGQYRASWVGVEWGTAWPWSDAGFPYFHVKIDDVWQVIVQESYEYGDDFPDAPGGPPTTTTTAPTTTTTTAPPSGDDDEPGGSSCPTGWSLLNPSSLGKLLRCLFIPTSDQWSDAGADVSAGFSDSGLGAVSDAVMVIPQAFGDLAYGYELVTAPDVNGNPIYESCEGPLLNLPLPGIEATEIRPLYNCDGPMEDVANIVRPLASVVMYIGSALACVRLLALGLGLQLRTASGGGDDA